MDIVKEFTLAGEVVQKFINLKNPVAIAMVLAGIREIMEPSEDGGSGSTGGSGKGGKGGKVKWSSEKKGTNIQLSPDGQTMMTGPSYVSWNCVLSEDTFSEGVHYVEVYLDKVANGYLFFGISSSSGVPYQECIGGSDPSLIAGYDSRFSQGSHPGVTQHEGVKNIPKFTKSQYVGLIIDQDKHELTYVIDGKKILGYSGIPSDVHIFACVAHDIFISFTRHIVGKDKIEKYLEKPETEYTPSEWVKERV